MTIRALTATALFAAFITALGFLPPVFVPFFPVPLSLHSLGPMLAGAMLGAKRGFYAVALFWLLLAAGLGFAGGSTGFAAFAGPMGGYIIGFGLCAFLIGWLYDTFPPRPNRLKELGFLAIGAVSLYIPGVLWLSWLTHTPLAHAAMLNCLFLPGDAAKTIICLMLCRSLRRHVPRGFR